MGMVLLIQWYDVRAHEQSLRIDKRVWMGIILLIQWYDFTDSVFHA